MRRAVSIVTCRQVKLRFPVWHGVGDTWFVWLFVRGLSIAGCGGRREGHATSSARGAPLPPRPASLRLLAWLEGRNVDKTVDDNFRGTIVESKHEISFGNDEFGTKVN